MLAPMGTVLGLMVGWVGMVNLSSSAALLRT
jgi:hypothetical protein